MNDLISRQAAIDALAKLVPYAICDTSTESYTNGLTDAYNLICQLPSAQPEQRWIPVSERLPKVDNINKRVLVTTSWGVVKEAYYCVDHWSIDDVDYKFSVAAWMPLPEPWKGEEE